MRSRKIIYTITVLFVLLLSAGCVTIFPPEEEKHLSGKGESAEATIVISNVTKTELKDRLGTRNNPFLFPHMVITPRYLYVFSAVITAHQDIVIHTEDITAIKGVDKTEAIEKEDLLQYWQNTGLDNDSSHHVNSMVMEQTLNKTCLSDDLNLLEGDKTTGYILFMTNKKDFLYDTLTVTLLDTQGEKHRIEINMEEEQTGE